MPLNETDIRWTDYTLNWVHGCSKTSEGCANCYAERVSRRFGHTDYPWTEDHAAENVQLKPEVLDESIPGPAWVFSPSMGDPLHEQVPEPFLVDVLEKCRRHERSAFQLLTKHGADHGRDVQELPQNVMLGVSVESPRRRYRIDWLREQPATTRFVSFEPLVDDILPVDLSGIDWAIIGGESDPDPDQRREMDPDWARRLVQECRRQDVPVFFKQHSGARPESDVRLAVDGTKQRIEEFPTLPDGVVGAPREFRPEVTV